MHDSAYNVAVHVLSVIYYSAQTRGDVFFA